MKESYVHKLMELDMLYGDAFSIWYHTKGKAQSYRWAKKQGLEFIDPDPLINADKKEK